MQDTKLQSLMLELTADVVSSHVSNNAVSVGDVPILIESVFSTFSSLGEEKAGPVEKAEPAVSIRASIKPDYLVCLEDGKKLKMLKRHLMTAYGMTPEHYRAKWNLPADYPMVAPNYTKQRRDLAKKIGLGRLPRAEEKPAPRRRQRTSKPA